MASRLLQPADSEESELRIVLLGRTGVGKSASGNTILGRDRFEARPSAASVTGRCERGTRQVGGQTLVVLDTPGLCHTNKSHEEVMKEIVDCITWTSPGPHVFLLVLRLGAFSRQDRKALDAFQNVFQDAANHTIVLFTHSGSQREVEAFIQRNEYLKTFMAESCGGYHAFDNVSGDESQVGGLLQKIRAVKNRRKHYSNELFERAVEALQGAMQCTEVRSASDPDEAAIQLVKGLISKFVRAGLEQAPPVLYEGVKRYLDWVITLVHDRMPPA